MSATAGYVSRNGTDVRTKYASALVPSARRPYAGCIPRLPRLQAVDAIYHVTARGNRRQQIFFDDADHERFLSVTADVMGSRRWACHSCCLMPNHYHFVLTTPEGDISEGMQRLNGEYAQWFNRRHGLDGHLFQGRFHSVVVESTWHLLELSRYLVLNPVRAGRCRHPAEWRWSSYLAATALERGPSFLAVDWLLEQFGSDASRAREAFRAFVDDAPLA